MQANPRSIRIALGCGLEPLSPHADPWTPPSGSIGFDGNVTVCPGYSTHLHDVREVAHARQHWLKGELRDFCGGDPSEQMLEAVVDLEFAYGASDNYWTTPMKDGGGQGS